jgi:hypothetical protein
MDFLPKLGVVFLVSLLVSAPARAQTLAPNGRAGNANDADSVEAAVISNIDLSGPFATREAWRFIATQGPPVEGILPGDEEPGPIQICFRTAPSSPCDPQLQNAPGVAALADDTSTQPHYLDAVEIVYPRGPADQPLLLVRTGSLHGANGSQTVSTQTLAYENAQNRFVRIYQHTAGTNNNGEVRYIRSGGLKGDVISVDPTENAPYGYWVSVNVLTPQYTYQTALRYRSATHYGDHNPLAVIAWRCRFHPALAPDRA